MQTHAIIQAQFFWVIHTPLLLLSKQCVKKQREFYEFVVHNNFVVISIMSLKPFSEELLANFQGIPHIPKAGSGGHHLLLFPKLLRLAFKRNV